MSASRSVYVGTCGLLLLTGCGAGTTAPAVTTPAPVVSGTKGATPATTGSVTTPAPAALVKTYLVAEASADANVMREGLKLTAPDSAAYNYLDHLANTVEAALDGGRPHRRADATPVGGGAFKTCNDPGDEKNCATVGDFKIDSAGKLVDLTVDKQPVGPRLTVGSGAVVTSGGTKFTFLTAYKTVASNKLIVNVETETGAKPIWVYTSTASYRGPDGKQRKATSAEGPTDIDAKSNTVVSMGFDSAKAGGNLTLDGCVGVDCSGGQFTAVIKVG